MSAREKLNHLFDRYDREKEALLEHIRRERFIREECKRIDHADESRPG